MYHERMRWLEVIKSGENNLIKYSKKLKVKKYRQENGEFMIEGVRLIEEAVQSGAIIRYCLCSDNLEGDRVKSLLKDMKDNGVKVFETEDKFIEDICDTKTPQGILAVVRMKEHDMNGIVDKSDFIIVLDRIQDPGNLGTMIRTADAAGAQGVIISDGTVDPYSPKVLRSTMGSIFHIPVVHADSIGEAIQSLKKKGYKVYVSSLEGSSPYYREDYRGKTAIVIGNEANGVDGNIYALGDRMIKIPMPGSAESLNAGIAAGILVFEVARQRMDVDK